MIRRSALNLNFQAGIARGDESVTTTSLLRRVRIAVTEAEKQEIGVLSWNEVKDPGAQPKTFGKIVSMGYMEQISLASLALNLLDRCPSIDAGLDLLSRRFKSTLWNGKYADHQFHYDFLSSELEYQWKHLHGLMGKRGVVHCTEEEYEKLNQDAQINAVQPVNSCCPLYLFSGKQI